MIADELKHALMNYHHMKRWKQLYDNKIEAVEYEMEGVKGINYNKEMAKGATQTNHEQRLLSLIEKKDKLIVASQYYNDMINEVESFINWVEEPYKQIIRDKYIHNFDDKYLLKKYHYTREAIRKIIIKLVDLYILSQELA